MLPIEACDLFPAFCIRETILRQGRGELVNDITEIVRSRRKFGHAGGTLSISLISAVVSFLSNAFSFSVVVAVERFENAF